MVNPFDAHGHGVTNFVASRHGAGRDRPRARQTSGGHALEPSGSGAVARTERDLPRAARHSARPAGEDRQPVCCRCLAFRIGSSAVQVGAVVRSADHPFATLRTDQTRRPQAVEHTLNEPVGLGLHGPAAGRCQRAATGRGARPDRFFRAPAHTGPPPLEGEGEEGGFVKRGGGHW